MLSHTLIKSNKQSKELPYQKKEVKGMMMDCDWGGYTVNNISTSIRNRKREFSIISWNKCMLILARSWCMCVVALPISDFNNSESFF